MPILTHIHELIGITGFAQGCREVFNDICKDSFEGPSAATARIANCAFEWIHCAASAWAFASVCALRTLHFGYKSPSTCVLNPLAFNTPVFYAGLGISALLCGTEAGLKIARVPAESKSARIVHFLHTALLKVTKVANIVTMVALLYLGAPVLGAAGLGLLYHGSTFVFDCFLRKKNEPSLLPHLGDRLLER